MTSSFRNTLLALMLTTCAWLPGTASAQGVLIGSADLDGDGIAEQVYNNGPGITVRSTNGSTTNYPVSSGSWALLYGSFSSVVDLDGEPGAEIPVNRGGSLLIISHRTRGTQSYPMSGSWAAAPGGIVDLDGTAGREITIIGTEGLRIVNQRLRSVRNVAVSGQFAVIGGAISDLDGVPGAEIPVANGQYLRIYRYSVASMVNLQISSGSWAVCTTGSNCVSDMNGDPGNELIVVVPNEIRIVKLYSTGGGPFANFVSNYWIGYQYAILSDGVREFDGGAGNDIAMARNDGSLLILRPRTGTLQTISGAGTFGSTWTLEGYANLDGATGDEIRVRSNTNNRVYRIYPRSGSVVAE